MLQEEKGERQSLHGSLQLSGMASHWQWQDAICWEAILEENQSCWRISLHCSEQVAHLSYQGPKHVCRQMWPYTTSFLTQLGNKSSESMLIILVIPSIILNSAKLVISTSNIFQEKHIFFQLEIL